MDNINLHKFFHHFHPIEGTQPQVPVFVPITQVKDVQKNLEKVPIASISAIA
jgi:hypothetical protein